MAVYKTLLTSLTLSEASPHSASPSPQPPSPQRSLHTLGPLPVKLSPPVSASLPTDFSSFGSNSVVTSLEGLAQVLQNRAILSAFLQYHPCAWGFLFIWVFFSLMFFLLELVSMRVSFTSIFVLQWDYSAYHSTCHTVNAPRYGTHIAEDLSNFVFQLLAPMNISPLRTRTVSSVSMVLTEGNFIHTRA